MKNYVYCGEKIELDAPAAVASGDPLLVGSLFGVAQNSAALGEALVLLTRGVFDLPKTSAQAWTIGVRLYWDNANKVVTTADGTGANKLIGVAAAAAANPSGVGRVLLTGAFTL